MVNNTNIQTHLNAFRAPVCVLPVKLHDGLRTTIYVVRHKRELVQPKVVVFKEPTVLLDWSLEHEIDDGIVGGFDLHHHGDLLGEVWTSGVQQPSTPVTPPWDKVRGSLYLDETGDMSLAVRNQLPLHPLGDLLQVGPLLVKNGRSLIREGVSPEGFSQTAHQFTPDPSIGRHPRSAIGCNEKYIWTVVSDARQPDEAGLTLAELADVMLAIGARDALNLDGGSSAQLVRRGRVLNKPWGQHEDHYPEGFPIRTAIIFEHR